MSLRSDKCTPSDKNRPGNLSLKSGCLVAYAQDQIKSIISQSITLSINLHWLVIYKSKAASTKCTNGTEFNLNRSIISQSISQWINQYWLVSQRSYVVNQLINQSINQSINQYWLVINKSNVVSTNCTNNNKN
jgi:hypothetical protein